MKNTLLGYTNLVNSFNIKELTQYSYEDYTEKDIKAISKLAELESDTYIDYYIMQDDEKIETISYELYGTTDYWDILMIINNRDPLFDMSYNFDLLSDSTKINVDNYLNNIYNGPNIENVNLDYYNEFVDSYKDEVLEKNEVLRTLKIILPSKIMDFIKIIKESGF